MLQPGVHTEIETIKGYVSVQLEGDGAVACSLHLAAAGLPGNPFIQPWKPPPSD